MDMDLTRIFAGATSSILPDNDAPGRAHTEAVAHALKAVSASIRVVDLPDLPPKGDVSDWLRRDPSGRNQLRSAIAPRCGSRAARIETRSPNSPGSICSAMGAPAGRAPRRSV